MEPELQMNPPSVASRTTSPSTRVFVYPTEAFRRRNRLVADLATRRDKSVYYDVIVRVCRISGIKEVFAGHVGPANFWKEACARVPGFTKLYALSPGNRNTITNGMLAFKNDIHYWRENPPSGEADCDISSTFPDTIPGKDEEEGTRAVDDSDEVHITEEDQHREPVPELNEGDNQENDELTEVSEEPDETERIKAIQRSKEVFLAEKLAAQESARQAAATLDRVDRAIRGADADLDAINVRNENKRKRREQRDTYYKLSAERDTIEERLKAIKTEMNDIYANFNALRPARSTNASEVPVGSDASKGSLETRQ